ncbi:MAG: DUF3568 domain-containing protein [Desulfobacterales bacterium]|nr:DUF3568 domain-containing protein [Desulfobacterales bacterium]
MIKKKSLPLLLFIALSLSGCTSLVLFGAGTGMGAGGYKYVKGSFTVIFQAPYMRTWDATLKALENLNFKIQSQEHNLTAGMIEGKGADDQWVRISIEYKSSQETEVVIRVGLFGDEGASMAIKEEIRKVLIKG